MLPDTNPILNMGALIFAGSPVSMLMVPDGKPARRASSARANAVSGVDSAGFRITCTWLT